MAELGECGVEKLWQLSGKAQPDKQAPYADAEKKATQDLHCSFSLAGSKQQLRICAEKRETQEQDGRARGPGAGLLLYKLSHAISGRWKR